VLSLCLIISCNDEEIPDTSAPNIIIESPTENQRVARTLTVVATAEDVDPQLSMQAFLDGTLLTEHTGLELTADIDTKVLTEGNHTLKITATDKAQNTSEKEVTFEVRNTLFKVKVSSNYVPEFTKIWFALSKNDGSLIAVNEVENGATMTVPTPADFNPDSTFVFSYYFHLFQDGSYSTLVRNMNVYAGMNAGEFNIAEFPPFRPSVGTHKVEVTDIPAENYFAGIYGTNAGATYGNFGNTGMISRDFNLNSNTSDLYFRLDKEGSTPVYKYVPTIQIGGSTKFSAIGLPEMKKASVTTKDAVGSYNYYVYNDDHSKQFTLYYKDGSFSDGKMPVYYPEGVYPQYVYYLTYQGSNSYINQIRGATPPTAFQYLAASVSNVNYSNQKLKVTSTGSFDILSISGASSQISNNSFILDAYSVNFPNSNKKQVTIPQTPALLSEQGFIAPGNFVFSNAWFSDYTTLAPSDYQTKIVFSADNLHIQYREFTSMSTSIAPTNNSGRVANGKKVTLPKSIETILKNHQIKY
jgi:hypothetical protein